MSSPPNHVAGVPPGVPGRGRGRGRGRQRRKRRDAGVAQGAATATAAPAGSDLEIAQPKTPRGKTAANRAINPATAPVPLVDIGINVTSAMLKKNWRKLVGRAGEANVAHILLTGTSIKCSEESIAIARSWHASVLSSAAATTASVTAGGASRAGAGMNKPTLRCTVGVHPHDAKTFGGDTVDQMRALLQHNSDVAVAVGECGLDYNRIFSPKDQQQTAFRAQVELACELGLPVFVHEREAHADLVAILDGVAASVGNLPPIVVHCFTGSAHEAKAYVDRGFYIGFTGTLCKQQRGAPLRALLPTIPLDRIMLETDAPWMGFVKGRRTSEPADVVLIAERLAETIGVPIDEVCRITTATASRFFGLPAVSAAADK